MRSWRYLLCLCCVRHLLSFYCLSWRRWHRFRRIGITVSLLAFCPTVLAGMPVVSGASFNISSFQWSEQQQLQLFGVPAFARAFVSVISVEDAVKKLANYPHRFQRAVVFKDRTVLSGMQADWHWVAEIESTSYGVKGLVSALQLNSAQLKRVAQARHRDPLSWLSSQSQLRFSQSSLIENRRVTQRIYSTSQPIDELIAYVQKNLRLSGWHEAPDLAWLPDAHAWRRDAAVLFLVPKVNAGVGALFVQHAE